MFVEDIFTAFLTHGEYFLRILISGLCGIMIGYERKNRLKEAGIRTHLIVAMGAALMMVVSKYGFSDILAEGGKADASRIASQIVTGVGFLGAGTIFVRKNIISGLTTAAGIWTTAGIGMAVGSGMYGVGILTAVAIVIVQKIFHGNIKILKTPYTEQITMRVVNNVDSVPTVCEYLKGQSIEVINISADKLSDEWINLEVYVKFPADYDKTAFGKIIAEVECIKSFEF